MVQMHRDMRVSVRPLWLQDLNSRLAKRNRAVILASIPLLANRGAGLVFIQSVSSL